MLGVTRTVRLRVFAVSYDALIRRYYWKQVSVRGPCSGTEYVRTQVQLNVGAEGW